MEAQGAGGSSPDNDGTGRDYQTVRVRQAIREGVQRLGCRGLGGSSEFFSGLLGRGRRRRAPRRARSKSSASEVKRVAACAGSRA